MNLMSRPISGFFVLTTLLLTSANMPAEWFLKLCQLTDTSGECVSLSEEQRKSAQLAQRARSAVERIYSKERVAEALISGKMSLLEAAALFRTLYEDPHSWHYPYLPRPQYKDGKGWCREVIRWMEIRTRHLQSPYLADALRDRLEAELQEQLDNLGNAILPE